MKKTVNKFTLTILALLTAVMLPSCAVEDKNGDFIEKYKSFFDYSCGSWTYEKIDQESDGLFGTQRYTTYIIHYTDSDGAEQEFKCFPTGSASDSDYELAKQLTDVLNSAVSEDLRDAYSAYMETSEIKYCEAEFYYPEFDHTSEYDSATRDKFSSVILDEKSGVTLTSIRSFIAETSSDHDVSFRVEIQFGSEESLASADKNREAVITALQEKLGENVNFEIETYLHNSAK